MRRTMVGIAIMASVVAATCLVPASARASSAMPVAAPFSTAETPQSLGVIVSFENTHTAPAAAQLISAVDGTDANAVSGKHGVYVFSSPYYLTDCQYATQLMVQSAAVRIAEPNFVSTPLTYTPPTDPGYANTNILFDYYSNSWGLRSVNADRAWALGQGDVYPVRATASDVKVGVIDVGAYLTHPDLSAGNVVGRHDYCDSFDIDPTTFDITFHEDGDVTPVLGDAHGTAVASVIGAPVDGAGVVGVAWNPVVYFYKDEGICNNSAGGFTAGSAYILRSQELAAIYGAADDGCKVINISQGGPDYIQQEQDAVDYAWSKGAVVVAAAGNEASNAPEYPASFDHVVSVSSLGLSSGALALSSFSSFGSAVDLSAPGEYIYAAQNPAPASRYAYWSGTSFSSPITAGAIAYLWRAMPSLNNAQVVSLLESTARPVGGQTGRSDDTGYGEVDMQAAYDALILAPANVSAPALTNQRNVPVTWSAVPGANVKYAVSVDGAAVATVTATGTVTPSLADGTHALRVVALADNSFNSTTTANLRVDATPPTISGLAVADGQATWSVSDASTYTVRAQMDSTSSPQVMAQNLFSAASASVGPHVIYVEATDAAGNSSGWQALLFAVLLPAPVSASTVVTDAVAGTVSWSPVGQAEAYEYSTDGGTTLATTSATSATVPLVEGTNTFVVRSVASGVAPSSWSTGTVTDVAIVPDVPVVSCSSTTAVDSVFASWPSAADARWYEYRVDGGAVTTTTARSVSLQLGSQGSHTVEIRSANNLRASSWADKTVTFTVPVTVVSAPAATVVPHVPVSWTAVAEATGYEYRLNGGASTATTATGVDVGGMVPATNTVDVRVCEGANKSEWVQTAVVYVPPVYLRTSVPVVSLGGTAALGVSGEVKSTAVTLQSSPDGSSWTDLAAVSLDANGNGNIQVAPGRNTYYRVALAGDVEYPALSSSTVRIGVKPILTVLIAPSSARRSHKFGAYGYLKPFSAAPCSVVIGCYRYQRRNGAMRWVRLKTVGCKVTRNRSYWRYSASMSLPSKGRWRLVPAYSANAVFDATGGGSRLMSVR